MDLSVMAAFCASLGARRLSRTARTAATMGDPVLLVPAKKGGALGKVAPQALLPEGLMV